MYRRILLFLSTLILFSSLLILDGSAVTLAESIDNANATGIITASEVTSKPPMEDEGKEIVATYHGKQINLAQGWQGAQICVEFAANDVKCFADDTELAEVAPEAAQVGTRGGSSCAYGYACIWEHVDYQGRRLQWQDKGKKNLADWNFRDQASSVCNNRRAGGFVLQDFRRLSLDPKIVLPAASALPNLTQVRYERGGDWNDKADAVELW